VCHSGIKIVLQMSLLIDRNAAFAAALGGWEFFLGGGGFLGETESTWYVGHYLAYCTSPG
jgi:hypothetical protein